MEEMTKNFEIKVNTNKIIVEEIDPEEINKLWDSLPEIRSVF